MWVGRVRTGWAFPPARSLGAERCLPSRGPAYAAGPCLFPRQRLVSLRRSWPINWSQVTPATRAGRVMCDQWITGGRLSTDRCKRRPATSAVECARSSQQPPDWTQMTRGTRRSCDLRPVDQWDRLAALSAAEDEAHRLGPGRRPVQLATHGTGERLRARLANPAHRHAQVLGLDHHHYAGRFEQPNE